MLFCLFFYLFGNTPKNFGDVVDPSPAQPPSPPKK